MESTIRLFKALPIEGKSKKKLTKELVEKTIKMGFILSPEVIANYPNIDLVITKVASDYGLDSKQLNSSFHKSWQKVRDASDEQLFYEQMVHYITTYGFESLGIYDSNSVYIPHEKLDIPSLNENVRLVVIKGYTRKELKEKVLSLVTSGIALKAETIEDLCDVIEFVGINDKEIETIKNRELKIKLYEELDMIPENPTDFLRYLVYKTTSQTLLIKNGQLIESIKENAKTNLFRKYKNTYGLEKLGQIFYRFKPLFLAFKEENSNRKYINKIRKLAKKNHQPMNLDYLNEITGMINNSNKIDSKLLKKELDKVNIFRKIRLAYALKYRTLDTEAIIYQVRNGKAYTTEFEFNNKPEAKRILKVVLDEIILDISKNVKGKKIYLPDHINYSLPSTEKQFVGNFPTGSYVSIDKDMVVGINWKDVDGNRIDLDLSTRSVAGKIGWDSSYRNDERSMLFSGDLTEASGPNGATELYYMKRQIKTPYTLDLNYYNYDSDIDVPFNIFVASESIGRMKQNYMVDPNNVICICKTKMDVKQKTLGLLVPTTNGTKYYFTDFAMGKSISAKGGDYVEQARDAMFQKFENQIELKDVLIRAGAKFVKEDKAEINLFPESLERDTILNLLYPGK